MRSFVILILLNIFFFAPLRSQQSDIKIDSGNNNKINVTQDGDSAQKSKIDIAKSDSNDIKVNQKLKDSTSVTRSSTNSFWSSANNSNVILGIIVSLIVIGSFIIGIVKYLRKKKD